MLVPVPLEQRTREAAVIVEGEVIAQQSFWDDAHQNIYTANTIEVYKLFKGSLQSTLAEVITEGGQVGLTRHVFSAALQLRVGQQGVFFLAPARHRPPTLSSTKTLFAVYSSEQGFIRYDLTAKTARTPFHTYQSIPGELYATLQKAAGTTLREVQPNPTVLTFPNQNSSNVVEDTRAIPVITSFSPASIAAGTGAVLTIKGLNFGASRGQGSVGFRNADDGGKTFITPLSTDYVSWTDTQIQVRVPSSGTDGGTAGSGRIQVTNSDESKIISAGELAVVFAYSNVQHEDKAYLPSLVNLNKVGGYTFHFSPTFNANADAANAFTRALSTWTCQSGINWGVGQSTSTTSTAEDDENTVRFDVGTELPSGVLARCISRYAGCYAGGQFNWYVTEIDLEFDDGANWQFGPRTPSFAEFDFESIALHELGHGHQLSHIILPRAVMHFGAGRSQTNRALNPANDIAGAIAVMMQSALPLPCGPDPMVPIASSSCTLPVELISLQARFERGTGVVLTWSTTVERNTSSFVIERSPDGSSWTDLGQLSGAGNSQIRRDYQATDPDPLRGFSFYRLRIINTDNEFGYSPVVRVVDREVAGLVLYPNPVTGATVEGIFEGASAQDTLTIRIYDNSGRLHQVQTHSLTEGLNFLDLELPRLAPGLYHLRWDNGTTTGSSKLVKL